MFNKSKSRRVAACFPAGFCLMVLTLALPACQSNGSGTEASDKEGSRRPMPSPESVPTFGVMTVDRAYAAIPHRRTEAQFAGSNIPAADQEYLRVIFPLVDQAIVLRVSTLQEYSRGQSDDTLPLDRMDRLIKFLQEVDPPGHLSQYHKRLEQGLIDQRAFFADWHARGAAFPYGQLATNAKVLSASSAIRESYQILMQSYPAEGQHNKEAFFDYHCALDFI